MQSTAGSSQWLAERRHLLRGGSAYTPPDRAHYGGSSGGGSPSWLTALAVVCVLWTAVVAVAKYGASSTTAPPTALLAAAAAAAGAPLATAAVVPAAAVPAAAVPAAAVPAAAEATAAASHAPMARSVSERTRCLDLVVSEMLLIDSSVSSPRQAALVWLAELVVSQGVHGDYVESGSKHGGTAVLLFAALMCSGEPRRLWTDGDWRDDVREWAATWQQRPGLAWRAEQLMRLPAQPTAPNAPGALATDRIALLVCGGSSYEATASCLRRCYPLMRRGGLVLVEEYFKHPPSRRATDEVLRESDGGAQSLASLYAVGEHSRPHFGFSRKVGPRSGAPLTYADIGRYQVLAANVSDAHPLLRRDDKCCNPTSMDDLRCCRPHAALFQRV